VAPIIAKLDEIIRLDHPNAFVIGRPRTREEHGRAAPPSFCYEF
jgi:hypothetical protein